MSFISNKVGSCTIHCLPEVKQCQIIIFSLFYIKYYVPRILPLYMVQSEAATYRLPS